MGGDVNPEFDPDKEIKEEPPWQVKYSPCGMKIVRALPTAPDNPVEVRPAVRYSSNSAGANTPGAEPNHFSGSICSKEATPETLRCSFVARLFLQVEDRDFDSPEEKRKVQENVMADLALVASACCAESFVGDGGQPPNSSCREPLVFAATDVSQSASESREQRKSVQRKTSTSTPRKSQPSSKSPRKAAPLRVSSPVGHDAEQDLFDDDSNSLPSLGDVESPLTKKIPVERRRSEASSDDDGEPSAIRSHDPVRRALHRGAKSPVCSQRRFACVG